MRVSRRSRRGEDGFTVTELMITLALSSMVITAIIGMLTSQQRAHDDINRFGLNQEDVRQTMILIQRDLRSAEPLTEVSNPLDLQYRVDLRVYEDVEAVSAVKMRWRVDATTNELVRERIDESTGSVIGTTHRLRGVANRTMTTPLFTYYKADGLAYDLTAAGTTPYTVAYCTIRVKVNLFAGPNGGRKPVQLVSDVQLRNRIPGAAECPG